MAVQILATGSEDIKDRLIGAGAVFLSVPPEGVPEELRSDIEWIHNQLTRFSPIGAEGNLRATMRSIRKKTGVKIAHRILYVYDRLRNYVENPEDFAVANNALQSDCPQPLAPGNPDGQR